jgi:hypothetical protein
VRHGHGQLSNRLLRASLDQAARLWDAETEVAITSPIPVLKENVGARMWDAEFSPDVMPAVTAGEDRGAPNLVPLPGHAAVGS